MGDEKRLLTEADKEQVFRTATSALTQWYTKEIAAGMSDVELENALRAVLGSFGGSGGPDQPSIVFTATGLRIWGSWHTVNHITEKPLFAGKATIAMARRVFNIANPDNRQMEMF